MIGHNILHPLFIINFNIKFLEKKDPTNQTWFSFVGVECGPDTNQ
jgi:hypothetical protein